MNLFRHRTLILVFLLAFAAGAGMSGTAFFYYRLESVRYSTMSFTTDFVPLSGTVESDDPSARRVVMVVAAQNARVSEKISFLVPQTAKITKQRPLIQNGALVGFDIPQAASFEDLIPGTRLFATIHILDNGDLSATIVTIGDPLPRP